MRQLLTEALAIAVAGAALGVLIAWQGLALIVAWVPTNSFAAESVIEMNLPVLLVQHRSGRRDGGRCSAIWPALQLSRPDLGRVVQAEHAPRDRQRARTTRSIVSWWRCRSR